MVIKMINKEIINKYKYKVKFITIVLQLEILAA